MGTKQILPPLDRFLNLMKINVFSWYDELPRIIRALPHSSHVDELRKGTISQYFTSLHCPVCETWTNTGTCIDCKMNPQSALVTLNYRIRNWEKSHQQLSHICYSCVGRIEKNVPCISGDCTVMYRLRKSQKDIDQIQ